MWDSPRKSYADRYKQYSCKHCWVWVRREIHWQTEQGEKFDGFYLAMECGHCNKLGKIHMKWNEDLHSKIPSGSRNGFFAVHNRGGCPPRGIGKPRASELEYEDEF